MRLTKEGVLRHAALLFAMMASGGNLIVTREIWVILSVICCLALLGWHIPLSRSRVLVYGWMGCVIALLIFLQGPADILSIASRAATFLGALLLLEVYLKAGRDKLMRDLFNILRLMCVQAILTSVLGNLDPDLFWVINVQGLDYHTFGLVFNFHYVHDVVAQYIRPDGFFYEPGVFQIYLSIFLYLTLFWRVDGFWATMACAALVALWSTIGLGIAALLLLLFSVRLFTRMRGAKRLFMLTVYAVVLPAVLTLVVFNYDQKVEGELRGSYLAREYDLYTGLNIAKEKPLTGIGFGVDKYLQYSHGFAYAGTELRVEQTDERPSSNGLVQVLYTVGLPLGVPLLLALLTQSMFRHRLAMAAILTASFYGQSVVFTPFFLFILFSGLVLNAGRARFRMTREFA